MTGIGIDVGGTYVKFFAVNKNGKILKTARVETELGLGADKFLENIACVVNDWKKELGGVTLSIGLPGDVDSKNGVLRFGTNLKTGKKHVTALPVAARIFDLTGIRPQVANDASMAAWGVYELEVKNKTADTLVVTLGTGVGGGIIAGGCLYQGANGCAGEIGHMCVDPRKTAPLCGCGARGCVEAFAGSKGIRRIARAAARKRPNSLLAKEIKKEKDFKIEVVYKTAKKGCLAAKSVWEEVGRHLGLGIANAVMLLDPGTVILTGGVSGSAEFFMPALKKVLAAQKIKTPFKNLKIIVSRVPGIGGIGAALYSMAAEAGNKQ